MTLKLRRRAPTRLANADIITDIINAVREIADRDDR